MTPREYAVEVTKKLQQAGYKGLWAGGCVRDQLIGREPKDYDVATNATPDQVRELFGKKRTIAIGESFGVITVIGPKSAGNIEIATFRKDAEYSDGRRPDAVEFTDAKEDALRRDFTINGMFFDPIEEQVIDYVDGRADIDFKVVRAIGDPHERIAEDKLRMLRAIRFAATYNFELEQNTKAAVTQHASEIHAVSPERVGEEMRRMLAHPNRAVATQLLQECELLPEILLDGHQLFENRANWRTRLRWLEELGADGEFETAAAIMLSRLLKEQGIEPTIERWKLKNVESWAIVWIENNLLQISRAHQLPWSTIQPLLINENAGRAVRVAEIQFGTDHAGVKFAKQKLALPAEELNPAPLVDGGDLVGLGLQPGPIFSKILQHVRNAQLDGEITVDGEISTRDQAIELAKKIAGLVN